MNYKSEIKAIVLCLLVLFPEVYAYANEEVTIGIFPRRNPTVTVKMFSPMIKYLQQETGKTVKLETAKNFPEFWTRVKKNRYDIVHYNQLHYVLSNDFDYTVFLKNEEFGKSLISSGLLIRKDSGIKTISDVRGKSIIFGGGELAFISNIGNRIQLLDNGIAKADYQSLFARNPPNAALAVFYKRADAAGVGSVVLEIPSVKKRINTEELKFLATSDTQPHLPWAFSKSMNQETRKDISIALQKLSQTPKGVKILSKAGLTNLVPATDEEYNSTRIVYKTYLDSLRK